MVAESQTTSNRPTLVFIHAFPLHSAMWLPQQKAFAPRLPTFSPDLPGFGGQSGLDGESFSMALAAQFVQRELDANGIDRVILAGLSMGGYIAFECWRLFGDRIDGMMFADTRAAADSAEGRAGRHAGAEQIGRGEFAQWAEALVVRLVSESTRTEQPELVDVLRRIMHSSPPESAAAALLGMASRNDSTPLLAGITVPVEVVVGEDDSIITVEESCAMAAMIPDAACTVIPRAGHLSNMENPDDFNTVVDRLLERVGKRTAV